MELNDKNILLKNRLSFPQGRISVVLDTDAFNEVDDQFAIAYLLCNPDKFDIKGIFAAPFFLPYRVGSPEEGMEKSYDEILHILGAMNIDAEGLAFRGSPGHMTPPLHPCSAPDHSTENEPLHSEAVDQLIKLARDHTSDEPLYVLTIGAATNIASAILLCPEIIDSIVVVFLTGHAISTKEYSNYDFNALGDLYAAKIIYDCGVPLIQMCVGGVTSHLLATTAELDVTLTGKNALCDILMENFRHMAMALNAMTSLSTEDVSKVYASRSKYDELLKKAYSEINKGNLQYLSWGKEIFDISTVAYYVNPKWFEMEFIPSPKIELIPSASDFQQYGWSDSKKIVYGDESRHKILSARWLNRNGIMQDMYKKLSDFKQYI